MRASFGGVLLVLLALFTAQSSAVAQVTWTGAVSANWFDANNWAANAGGPGTVPDGTTDAILALAANNPVVNSGAPITNNLTITPGASLSLGSGAHLTINGDLSIVADATPSTGALSNSGGSITLLGSWHQDDPTAFVYAANTVLFSGTAPASITGADGITFATVTLGAGKTLSIQTGRIVVTTDWNGPGSAAGPGVVRFTGNGTTATGVGSIANVEVTAGNRRINNSTFNDLDLITGTITVNGNQTLTVTQNADLTGGNIAWVSASSVIDALGNVTHVATTNSSSNGKLRCHGHWSGTGLFSTPGTVEFFDQATIGGTPTIANVFFKEGTTTLLAPLTVTARMDMGPGDATGEPIDMVGSSNCYFNAGESATIHHLRIQSGNTTPDPGIQRIAILEVLGGNFRAGGAEGSNVIVTDTARLVDGSLVAHAGSSPLTCQAELQIAKDFYTNLFIDMDGPNTSITGINGVASVPQLRIKSGNLNLTEPIEITSRLEYSGGTASGQPFDMVSSSNCYFNAGESATIHHLRIQSGNTTPDPGIQRIAILEVLGGNFRAGGAEGSNVIVTDTARLVDGSLVAYNGYSPLTCQSELQIAKDFFTNLFIDMDGPNASIAGIGGDPVIPRLRIVSGETTFDPSLATPGILEVTTELDIEAEGALRIVDDELRLLGSSSSVGGGLLVGPGGSLRLASTSNLTIAPSGRLELIGMATAPATVTSSSPTPGYSLTINGTIAARHFVFEQMSANGILLGASSQIAAIPNDFRDGRFDRPKSGSSSRLLTVETPGPLTFPSLVFDNSTGTAQYNVQRSLAAVDEVTFLNWSGLLGGDAWELDPSQNGTTDLDGKILWSGGDHPDLRPLNLTFEDDLGIANQALPISFTVLNQGGVAAQAPWNDYVLLRPIGSGPDLVLGTYPRATDLVAGDLYIRDVSPIVPPATDGDFRLLVVTDVDDDVTEPGGETNNEAISLGTVKITPFPKPDLQVTAIGAPAEATDGEFMSVSWTVTNLGNGPAVGDWIDRVYLSSDPFYGNDFVLGSFSTGSLNLPKDQSYLRDESVLLPAGIHGPYYVIVRTDYQNSITTDISHTNNTTVAASPTNVIQKDLPDLFGSLVGITAEFDDDPNDMSFFAGTTATFAWSVTNLDADNNGKGTAFGSWVDRVYLSDDALLGGDTLVASSPVNTSLSPGDGYSGGGSLIMPDVPGMYYLLVDLDADGSLDEGDNSNNLLTVPFEVKGTDYTGIVETDFTVGASPKASGEVMISLHGSALEVANPLAKKPNVPLTVRVHRGETRRVYNVVTDASGDFQLDFVPLIGEAGFFDLYADHPTVVELPGDPPQDTFELISLSFYPATESLNIPTGSSKILALQVTNPGDNTVSGINAVALNIPSHLVVTGLVTPSTLGPYASGNLMLTLNAVNDAPTPNDPAVVEVVLSAQVGTRSKQLATANLYTWVSPQTPVLTVTPNAINGKILKGEITRIEFTISNTGGAPATLVTINDPCLPNPGFACPQGDVIQLVTPQNIGTVAPGESRLIAYDLLPTNAFAVGGQIQVPWQITSAELAPIAFQHAFTIDSSATGSVTFEVEDEATYWSATRRGAIFLDGAGPLLAGATVELYVPGDPTKYQSGITDMIGTIGFPDVPEGQYGVRVTAPMHGTYNSVLKIQPGQEQTIRAFIPIQTVTYEWTVEETEIKDEYEIDIEATFETQVPAPTILVQPPVIDLAMAPGQTEKQLDLLIANSGLVTAKAMELFMDDLPGYAVTPLVTDIGDLAPGEVRIISVHIALTGGSLCGATEQWGLRHYVLMSAPQWYWTPIFYKFPTTMCQSPTGGGGVPPNLPPPTNPPPGNPGGSGGSGSSGSSGGGSGSGSGPSCPSYTPPPPITVPENCAPPSGN